MFTHLHRNVATYLWTFHVLPSSGAFAWGFVATLFGVPHTLVSAGAIPVAVGIVGLRFLAKSKISPRPRATPVSPIGTSRHFAAVQ
jgi:hypothetical protein